MSGLPRSGSTLLSSILNQNPKIHSGPSSPVTGLMVAMENLLSTDELYLAYPKPKAATKLVSSIIENYYSDVDEPIIIDKNRSWVNRPEYIMGYFGQHPKIICPVRNIDEILASFISMHRRNGVISSNGKINFIDEMLIKNNIPLTDDNRCEFIASPNGILGQSYTGIQSALQKGYQKSLHFVEYNNLINNPEETIKKIYEFLELPEHAHDFSNIVNVHKENDSGIYGFDDMHHVRNELKKVSIKSEEILSEQILKKCENTDFWRNLDNFEVNKEETENFLNNQTGE
jgi:sulfotransferase